MYCGKFFTLSNQMSHYKSKSIRIVNYRLPKGGLDTVLACLSFCPLSEACLGIFSKVLTSLKILTYNFTRRLNSMKGSAVHKDHDSIFCIPSVYIFLLQLLFDGYSKTCLKQPLKEKTKIHFQDRLSLNAGQKYCRMLQESILQYFRPSLSYHMSIRPLFFYF